MAMTGPLPRDHRLTAATIVMVMAIAAILAFVLMSLARAPKAY
jgi:hypothetical protein